MAMVGSNPEQPERKHGDFAESAGDARVTTLLGEHLGPLTAFVRLRAGRELRAKESISDLVQSTCREILAHGDRFQDREDANFRLWLYTTAERKVRDKVRYWRAERRSPGREIAQTSQSPELGDDVLPTYRRFCTPSSDSMLAEEIARIEGAIAALPDEHREVILLFHVVGLSHAEIAGHLGKTEASTRKMLSRALAKLAMTLG